MHVAFTAEHEELIRTLRNFARKELAPRSAQWDRNSEFPRDAWRQMGELGLLGLRTPAAYGGQEADYITFGIAMQEIGRGDFSCTYGIQLAGLAGEILGRSGSEEIKTRWLPPTARGETVIALKLRRLTPVTGEPRMVEAGDRLDLYAQRIVGDPTQFWHVADANTALDQRTLVAEPGDTLLVPKG